MLLMEVFSECIQSCVKKGKLDTLVLIIERCKAMDQTIALCPPWSVCNYIVEIVMQDDNSKLAFYEFMVKWIARGEMARPPVHLSMDERLVLLAFGIAGRTFSSTLLDASWAIVRRSLRQKNTPSPASYICSSLAGQFIEGL
ncbi:pentatricopeptide repeat-containing protein At1g26460, mitochondrial-like [Syzygium oleosum]|uniref:pentatricopeptide repeat-containing protein At1g26460, mitochondrial-like n=1 Tax=Syzygium oleosum TaxID=219896 RepID=UPI0024BAE13E|nr:pentatricopeptide repeat-containing protein At1g26460, mitochondrial-like [Syzygium oleosum]